MKRAINYAPVRWLDKRKEERRGSSGGECSTSPRSARTEMGAPGNRHSGGSWRNSGDRPEPQSSCVVCLGAVQIKISTRSKQARCKRMWRSEVRDRPCCSCQMSAYDACTCVASVLHRSWLRPQVKERMRRKCALLLLRSCWSGVRRESKVCCADTAAVQNEFLHVRGHGRKAASGAGALKVCGASKSRRDVLPELAAADVLHDTRDKRDDLLGWRA